MHRRPTRPFALAALLVSAALCALASSACKGEIDDGASAESEPSPGATATAPATGPAMPGQSAPSVATPPVDPASALAPMELPPGARAFEIKFPPSPCGTLAECKALCDTCEGGDNGIGTCDLDGAKACKHVGDMALRAETLDLNAAADAFEQACKTGYGVACSAYGNMLVDGRGRSPDERAGHTAWERGCELGAGVGCFNRAMVVRPGVDNPWYAKALAAYTAECSEDPAWCMNLAVLYEHGYGVEQNPETAREIYAKACADGHNGSCTNLALLELADNDTANDATGAERLEKACYEQGAGLACGALGQQLAMGLNGRAPDPLQGRVLLEGACRSGETQPCAVLGAMLMQEGPLEADIPNGQRFLERACKLGHSASCFLLGMQFMPNPEGGEMIPGVSTDPGAAVVWLERACWIGDAEGCMRAAAIYELGVADFAAQPERSTPLLHRGCGLYFGAACMGLLDKGEPLPLTKEEADLFYTQACRQGFAPACEHAPIKPLSALPGQDPAMPSPDGAGAAPSMHGDPGAAAPAPGEPSTGEPGADEPSTGEPAPGEPSTGEPAPGEPAPGEPSTGEPAPGEPAPGEPAPGEPSTGEPARGEPTPIEPARDG